MLAFMHEGEPYGHLRLNEQDIGPEALARMVGSPPKEVKCLLAELERAGVFSRTKKGTIFSRRMVRDEAIRESRAVGGHLSLNNPAVPRKKDNSKDGQKDTLHPSFEGSPSSSSSSFLKTKNTPASRRDMLNGHRATFEVFWSHYPRKRHKGQAERVWAKLKPDDVLLGEMLAKLEQAKQTPDWTKDDGQFIPHPATWLNGKGWEDEYPTASQQQERIPL